MIKPRGCEWKTLWTWLTPFIKDVPENEMNIPGAPLAKKQKREREGTAVDLRDNDSPAVYSCWAFNLGSWSSHDDDAAASSPFRLSSFSVNLQPMCTFREEKGEKGNTLFDTKASQSLLTRRSPRGTPASSIATRKIFFQRTIPNREAFLHEAPGIARLARVLSDRWPPPLTKAP